MGKFGLWLHTFMQGRYGFDQYGRHLGVIVIVLWIISTIVGVFANLFGRPAVIISFVLNWAGMAVLAYMIFRILSKNIEKRRAENEKFLQRKAKKNEQSNAKQKSSSKDIFNKSKDEYKYLTCAFCGQEMRVPSGKGKIAVKCPSCGEKTIIQS